MIYDNKPVDLSYIQQVLDEQADPSLRNSFLLALRYRQGQENDDVLLGVMQFLEDHHWRPEALRAQLRQLEQPISASARQYRLLPYAAILATAITAIAWLMQAPGPPISQTHIPLETGLPNFLGSDDALNKWRPVMAAYARHDFTASANALKALSTDYPNNDTLYYLQGVVAFQSEQYSEAAQYFLALPDTATSAFGADRDIFLALALLHSGDKVAARELFRKLQQDEDHPYQHAADTWLIKLK